MHRRLWGQQIPINFPVGGDSGVERIYLFCGLTAAETVIGILQQRHDSIGCAG